MKSLQFRSIAPKAPPPPPPPPPALLSETKTNPSPLLVPAQNYALMQVAGQEGTFSLVPLPASPSPTASSPQQQPISKSLKLPIPRYQPMRSKGTPEKAGNSKTGGSPAKVAMMTPARLSIQSKASEVATVPKESLCDSLVFASEAGSEGKKAGPPLGTLAPKPLAVAMPTNTTDMIPPSCQVTPEKKCQSAPSQPITVLSPALFGKTVKLISPPPSGKLPILPYSRVKDKLLANSASANTPVVPPPAPPPVPPPPPPLTNRRSLLPLRPTTSQSVKRKRGRRRKTAEDILALEARRKRALTFFRRRPQQQPPPTPPQQQAAAATPDNNKPPPTSPLCPSSSRKYRSIRPKPDPSVGQTPPLLLTSSLSPSSSLSSSPPQPASLTLHPCPTCGRCFQHKPHLTSHMTTHLLSSTNHGKASSSRPPPLSRPSLRCPFCQKSFSYVGVFFSHLRELHRVILTVEPSIAQHEEHTPGTESGEEEMEDPVELQIKCGRCQAVTPTFSDMQLHLHYVHGQGQGQGQGVEPGPSGGGVLSQSSSSTAPIGGGRTVEEELVKHAAHYWRQLNERRGGMRRRSLYQEMFPSRLHRRHPYRFGSGAGTAASQQPGPGLSLVRTGGRGFDCFLCSALLDSKQEVLEHWRGRHHCEKPALLWEVLSGEGKPIDDATTIAAASSDA